MSLALSAERWFGGDRPDRALRHRRRVATAAGRGGVAGAVKRAADGAAAVTAVAIADAINAAAGAFAASVVAPGRISFVAEPRPPAALVATFGDVPLRGFSAEDFVTFARP